jgi:beta-glucosidase
MGLARSRLHLTNRLATVYKIINERFCTANRITKSTGPDQNVGWKDNPQKGKSMKPEKPGKGDVAFSRSRRDFLAASAALAATLALDGRNVMADERASSDSQISQGAFDHARERASALVKQMTLEEVVGQVGNNAPALPRLGLSRYDYWTEALHGVNADGPITSFPQPIALGCSWNPQLVFQVYTAVSDEARAYHSKTGRGLTFFSPATVNMGLRDPRWGRVNENFSEDPWLVQTLAVQTVLAMQGDDPKHLKTVACAKHFACNDTDTDRVFADAAPDRRSFWEYYMRGFEAAVMEGRVFSVMSAYNSLWGIPCSASHLLLTEILRDRWGFKGYVVSDCDAIGDIYRTHHFVETGEEAAALAIKAGSDLNCGRTLSDFLMKSVQTNLVTEQAVRTALTRVLTGRFLLGEFDPPASVPWSDLSPSILEDHPHRELAREAARQSLVLLKNEGQLLPLDKTKAKSIAVIGPMAGSCHLGGYSGRSTYLISPYAGVAAAMGIELFADAVSGGEYLSTSNFRGPVVGFTEDGRQMLTNVGNNSWAQYGPIDFNGKTSIDFDVASQSDGEIALYLDSFDAKPSLTASIPATGGMEAWKTVTASTSEISGQHIVFLRFTSSSRDKFLNLRSFRLLPSANTKESAVKVVYAPGCSITGSKIDALFESAVKAASQADVALVFVGDNRLLSDESRDRFDIALPEVQQDLIKAVLAANSRTVVVINSTCPVALTDESQKAPAILCSLFAGEQQGNAIADALFGACNPCGKLCSTWYRDVDQLPNFHDYDLKHGRTYMYFHGAPLYPFGHGISYTSFAYKNLHVDSDRLLPGNTIQVSVDVTNTGDVAGDEVVQLYVHSSAKVQRPNLQLAGFNRVPLPPGQTKTITFSLPHDHIALQYWDESKNEFAYDAGNVDLLVGSSSADIRLRGQVMLV